MSNWDYLIVFIMGIVIGMVVVINNLQVTNVEVNGKQVNNSLVEITFCGQSNNYAMEKE